MAKKLSIISVKIIIGALLLWYIVAKVDVQALTSTLNQTNIPLALLAIIFFGTAPIVGSWRWKMLMGAQDLNFKYKTTIQWSFIGMFYNSFMPGLTGGDVVKSWYVATKSHNKTAAVMTVVVDRITGVIGMALLGAIFVFLYDGYNVKEFYQAGFLLYGFLLTGLTFAIIFFSKAIRCFLRFDKIISILPFSKIVTDADKAVFVYRKHLKTIIKCVSLSLLVHISTIFGMYLFGMSLGVKADAYTYQSMLALIPVVFILSSLSITPAGLGVGESLSIFFLGSLEVSSEQALGIMLFFRLAQMIWGLVGGVILLVKPSSKTAKEIEAEMID